MRAAVASRSACGGDQADAGELQSGRRLVGHANQRLIVESLDDKGALSAGLDVDHATDILWTINHPNLWQLLVDERGWTAAQYEQWCAELACAQLLGRRTGR